MRRLCGAALLSLFAALPARADLSACYDVTWLGFPLAELVYEEERADAVVHTNFVLESVGLVDLFGPFRYAATADTGTGDTARNGVLRPLGYTVRHGPDPSRWRIIDLGFDAETGAVDEIVRPPRERTKVEPPLRRGAIDPITAFLSARHAVPDALEGETVRLRMPVYDGSKRYDIELVFVGRSALRGHGDAVKALGTLHPVAGFDDPREGTMGPAEVWFALDGDHMPLKVRADGPGALTLVDYNETGGCRF